MSRWRFQPTERIEDAFCVLEAAKPHEYRCGLGPNGLFWARVVLADGIGEARQKSQAKAITLAVARALGIEAPVEP
jgi:hypothetical protein